jgi:hypothetical protein
MYKAILTTLLVLVPITVFAAPTPPPQTVRAEPANAKKGEKVSLEAFVYNSYGKTVTVEVMFSTPDEEIETISLTLPTQSGKTATTEWTGPEAQTVVTASIVRAVDSSQKTVPELLGVIGTVTVGAKPSTFSIGNLGISAKSWVGTIFQTIDPWRIKQALKYEILRDQKRKELGISTMQDLTDQLTPKAPEAPALPGDDAQRLGDLSNKAVFPIGTYATLFYASALAGLFGSIALFYICLVVLLLMLLRFFFRLFV